MSEKTWPCERCDPSFDCFTDIGKCRHPDERVPPAPSEGAIGGERQEGTDAERDYRDMRRFQEAFIRADHALRDAKDWIDSQPLGNVAALAPLYEIIKFAIGTEARAIGGEGERRDDWRARVKHCHALLEEAVGWLGAESRITAKIWDELKPCENYNDCPSPRTCGETLGALECTEPFGHGGPHDAAKPQAPSPQGERATLPLGHEYVDCDPQRICWPVHDGITCHRYGCGLPFAAHLPSPPSEERAGKEKD